MRRLFGLLFALLLVGCASTATGPSATPQPEPTIPAVAERLAAANAGPFEAIGYLWPTADGAALVGGLSYDTRGDATILPAAGAIWLGDLPPLATTDLADGERYMLVHATGRLEPPGAYGPGGAYRYQLAEPLLEPLGVRELTIALLLDNSGLYDNQPVRLRGQLLRNASTALLVERLGSGGVPDSNALQIKLTGTIDDSALAASVGSGTARFGPVQVVGLWRRGTLHPLAIRTSP